MALRSWYSQQTSKLSMLNGGEEGIQPLRNLTPMPEAVQGMLDPFKTALAYQISPENPRDATVTQSVRPF